MNKLILSQLADRLQKIGECLDFHKLVIRSSGETSEIYVMNSHALQLEVDWKENNLYMYAVFIKNDELPDERVIYRYTDEQWCRKYLEEVYQTKRPFTKDHNRRYSSAYLFDCFEFYNRLISKNPMILKEFGVTGKILRNKTGGGLREP